MKNEQHDDDCATQCGFSGENSDVTTHPCTCKTPNPMKIVATPQEILEAIENEIQSELNPTLRSVILNLSTLPTLRDELLKYELTGEDGSYPFTGADEGYINAVTSRIDSYLTDKTTDTTHSKQG